eukprot:SAG31_NODE_1117_length_9817_cov_6.416650_6_plen_114_part_00
MVVAPIELAEPEKGNTAWRKLCGLLGVKDADVLEAGKAEDKRLLRLWADLNETNMKTVEEVLAEKDAALADKDAALADKDTALADKDTALADKDAELVKLRAQLAEASAGTAE